MKSDIYFDRFRREWLKNEYELEWEGYKCLVYNMNIEKDNLNNDELYKKYDILIDYHYGEEGWNFCLRTMKYEGLSDKKINVDHLACKYGGRGHTNMHYHYKTFPSEAFITFEHFPWILMDAELAAHVKSQRFGHG